MKFAKLVCNNCEDVILRFPTTAQEIKRIPDKLRPLANYLVLRHKELNHPPICESCKQEIQMLRVDDFGEPIDWNTRWEQYLCDDCYAKIWGGLLDNACGVCKTEPCKKGKDCWVNPFPRIMYLCYVAPRKKQTGCCEGCDNE